MTVHFKRINDRMHFMNPSKDFSMDELSLEIRYDPLTGQTTRVFDTPYKPIDRPNFKEIVKRSRKIFCPFCPESLEKSTTVSGS